MATGFKSVIAFLAIVMVVTTAACAGDPASNIDATIEAGIAATMVGVELENAVKATMAPPLAKEHFNRGFTYGKLGEYEKAIQEYDKVIQLNPAHTFAYFNRGHAYYSLGQHQRTIQDFDKVIQLNPKNEKAYSNRGYTYFRLGQYQRAIQDYDEAIQLDPNRAFFYDSRSIAYRNLGQDAESDADKAKACSLDNKYC